jgi:hypothetical protein
MIGCSQTLRIILGADEAAQPKAYAEFRRVLKPGGAVAIWVRPLQYPGACSCPCKRVPQSYLDPILPGYPALSRIITDLTSMWDPVSRTSLRPGSQAVSSDPIGSQTRASFARICAPSALSTRRHALSMYHSFEDIPLPTNEPSEHEDAQQIADFGCVHPVRSSRLPKRDVQPMGHQGVATHPLRCFTRRCACR